MKRCQNCKGDKELIYFWRADDEIFTQCSECRSLPRVCTKCHKIKDHSEFYIHRTRTGNYAYNSDCKQCVSISNRGDKRRDRKRDKKVARKSLLKRCYGLTLADYDCLLEAQGRSCAICKCTENGSKEYLAVDHDHETGEIRGLLCDKCNSGIGFLRDDPDLVEAAARYLRETT